MHRTFRVGEGLVPSRPGNATDCVITAGGHKTLPYDERTRVKPMYRNAVSLPALVPRRPALKYRADRAKYAEAHYVVTNSFSALQGTSPCQPGASAPGSRRRGTFFTTHNAQLTSRPPPQ